jgi:hypothetical protein
MRIISLTSENENRETVEEFLARGGQILVGPSVRAKGTSVPKMKVKGKSSSNYLKNNYQMGYKISSIYNR